MTGGRLAGCRGHARPRTATGQTRVAPGARLPNLGTYLAQPPAHKRLPTRTTTQAAVRYSPVSAGTRAAHGSNPNPCGSNPSCNPDNPAAGNGGQTVVTDASSTWSGGFGGHPVVFIESKQWGSGGSGSGSGWPGSYNPFECDHLGVNCSGSGQHQDYWPGHRSGFLGNFAIGVCGSGIIGFVGSAGGSFCIVISHSASSGRFQVGSTETVGGGTGAPALGATGGLTVSNAPTISSLGGPPFLQAGGSGTFGGVSAGGDYFSGASPNNRPVWGGTIGIGPKFEAPFVAVGGEGHFWGTYTWTQTWFAF